MIRGKKHIFGVLFFIYFLLYVVSPVCYAGDSVNEKIIITHGAKQNLKNLHVIWELILSKIAQKENSENNGSGVQFFIKKARAVLTSNNTVKAAQSESDVISLDNLFSQMESVAFCIEFTDTDPRSGFYSSFSGLSPPRV